MISKKGLVVRSSWESGSRVVATLPRDSVVVRVTERSDGTSFVVSYTGDSAGWAASQLLKAVGESGRSLRRLREGAEADRSGVGPWLVAQACLECEPERREAACDVYATLLDLATDEGGASVAAAACLFGMASSPSVFRVKTRSAPTVDKALGTVVLLGWGGCHVSELDGVDAFYEAHLPGWASVATTASALRVVADDDDEVEASRESRRLASRVRALREAQYDVVIQACEAAVPEGGVVVHAFSNNGAAALAELLARAPRLAARLRAVAFDSAATLDIGPSMEHVAKGAILGDLTRLHAPSDLLVKAAGDALGGAFRRIFARAGGDDNPMDSALRTLVEASLPKTCPLLFLYSSTDTLISMAAVDAFIDAIASHRDDARAKIARHVFDGSGHIRHFRTHRDDYTAQLLGLLSRAGALRGSQFTQVVA